MKTLNETHQKSCTQAGGPREEPATKALPAISPPARTQDSPAGSGIPWGQIGGPPGIVSAFYP